MVADITPGAGGTGGQYSGPYNYTTLGDTVFFNASDGVTGLELWKTDGTEAGTVLVKDINPGRALSGSVELTVVNDRLFFTTVAPSSRRSTVVTELWDD